MIKKSDLDTYFKHLACKASREPANHKYLGKKVYYRKHDGVVKRYWGQYAGIVIVAFKIRAKGTRVAELVIKKGNGLHVARPDMLTTTKPR